jgi:hypothetical protein
VVKYFVAEVTVCGEPRVFDVVDVIVHRRLAPAVAEVRASLASLDVLRGVPAGRLRLCVSAIAESFLS